MADKYGHSKSIVDALALAILSPSGRVHASAEDEWHVTDT